MERPLVSVVIPNYNYADFVVEAIESVLRQTYSQIEIIVVDDGSTDGSEKTLAEFGDKITCIFQKNKGVSAARNNGVVKSSGKYIAFLDADDIWKREKIEKEVKILEKHPEKGMVHVGVEYIDVSGGTLKYRTDGLSGWIYKDLLLFELPAIRGGGSGGMVRRRVFDEIQGFDLEMTTSADWDLFYRISCRYQVGYVPEALLKYRLHGSNMHGNIHRMEREMLYGFKKAYDEGFSEIKEIKRVSYSNLHRVLSGSFFRAGQYKDFARHAFKSILLNPLNLTYFAAYPLRLMNRD